MTYTIVVPPRLTLQKAIEFCDSFHDVPVSEEIIFDFNFLKYIEPFGMAYVSCQIKNFVNDRTRKNKTVFKAKNHEKHSYMAHMGFFKAFGLNFGNSPGQAFGSSTYIPLTIIDIGSIKSQALSVNKSVGDIVEGEAESLAKMLIRSESGELLDTLTYSLREIMRNVVEHSNSQVLEFCAQFWPTKNKVEIVVLDLGVGIKESLSNNPYLTLNCDRDAIQLSLLPGISGKMYKGVKKNHYDVWQNSGFGLYMTSRIARAGGSFFIGSGEAGILLELGTKSDITLKFKGTALRMVINTSRLIDLKTQLDKFRKEGYEVSKELNNLGQIESSTASMMLSRDFS